jgi:hypothetical protein
VRILDDNRVLMRELREALGRTAFVYGALIWDKPFLGPLYTFLALWSPGACVELPLFVRMIITWLLRKIRERRAHPCAQRRTHAGAVMRVDAKAEGDEVAIGGWLPLTDYKGKVNKAESPWFAITLDRDSAPWAFDKGAPYKAISALELLASTVGIAVFAPELVTLRGQDALITVTGTTDSQVSASVVARGMTTRFPLVLVAMELSAKLEELNARFRTRKRTTSRICSWPASTPSCGGRAGLKRSSIPFSRS